MARTTEDGRDFHVYREKLSVWFIVINFSFTRKIHFKNYLVRNYIFFILAGISYGAVILVYEYTNIWNGYETAWYFVFNMILYHGTNVSFFFVCCKNTHERIKRENDSLENFFQKESADESTKGNVFYEELLCRIVYEFIYSYYNQFVFRVSFP